MSLLVRGFAPGLASGMNMIVDYLVYTALVVYLALKAGRRMKSVAISVVGFWLLAAGVLGLKYSLAIAWSEHIPLSIGVLEYQLLYAKNLGFATLVSVGVFLAYTKFWKDDL